MIFPASRITKSRRGVSLTEALIAVGILTIGLISLLSLFPVGAIRMAQAVRDDRVAMLSANGDSLFRAMWRKAALDQAAAPDQLVKRSTLNSNASWTLKLDQASDSLSVPNLPSPPSLMIANDSRSASWSVLLDSVGNTVNGVWVGNDSNNAVGWLRRDDPLGGYLSPAPVSTPRDRVRLNYTTDDLTFGKNGAPFRPGIAPVLGEIERAERYSYAWLVNRPDNAVYEEVRLRILTFQNRAPEITKGKEEAYNLSAFSSTGVKISTTTTPIFRKGQWVLMAYQPITSTVAANPSPFVTAYRVLNMTQSTTISTDWDIEFQQPIPTGNTPIGQLRLIAMENLVEVFDRGIISPFSIPGFSNAK